MARKEVLEGLQPAQHELAAPQRRPSWRRIQLDSWEVLRTRLDSGTRAADMVRIQRQLTEWVTAGLRDGFSAQEFVNRWPVVLGGCNDPAIYLDAVNVQAYCHIHFLERYRRFYAALEQLYQVCQLPMRDGSLRVLDMGSGPAPSLYAVQDFYSQVVATLASMDILRRPGEGMILRCVEQSPAMGRFLHHFSELGDRPGPFFPSHPDIMALDRQALRQADEKANREAEQADWDDPDAPWPIPPADFKNDLYIFSNVLTTEEFVSQAKMALTRLFYWPGPHQTVVVLGASNEAYQRIYSELDEIAARVRVDRVAEVREIILWGYEGPAAVPIKIHYNQVWKKIKEVCSTVTIPEAIKRFRDLWDPATPLSGPVAHSLRLYRRIRLAPGRKWKARRNIISRA